MRVGQEEFEQQWSRHGGSRQLSKLAKAIARIIFVMGLEPGLVAGTKIPGDGEDQCELGASQNDTGDEYFWISFGCWFWFYYGLACWLLQ